MKLNFVFQSEESSHQQRDQLSHIGEGEIRRYWAKKELINYRNELDRKLQLEVLNYDRQLQLEIHEYDRKLQYELDRQLQLEVHEHKRNLQLEIHKLDRDER